MRLFFVVVLFCVIAEGTAVTSARYCGAQEASRFAVVVRPRDGEIHPQVIRDVEFGLCYELVKGGDFRIGDNNLSDSRSIEVTLSNYYISTTPACESHIAKYLVEGNAVAVAEINRLLKANDVVEMPDKYKEDWRDCISLIQFHTSYAQWPAIFDFDTDSRIVYEAWLVHFIEISDSIEMSKVNVGGNVVLNPLEINAHQRLAVKESLNAIRDKLAEKVASGSRCFDQASFYNASEFAMEVGCRLPTEAQWEVAGRLSQQGNLGHVTGLLDESRLEWCRDFYSYQYYNRQSKLSDPQGPTRGELSEAQIDEQAADSQPEFATRMFARNIGVLRGQGSPTKRCFASRLSAVRAIPFDPPRVIRLVIDADSIAEHAKHLETK